jgi:hypothetical protein
MVDPFFLLELSSVAQYGEDGIMFVGIATYAIMGHVCTSCFLRARGSSLSATRIAGGAALAYNQLGGLPTRTTSPTDEQVAYCRDWLFINPDMEIEPLAYYLKPGMDYQVRFKFTAKTNAPGQVFDSQRIESSEFVTDFPFPPGESSHNEDWWDVAAHPLSGGSFTVPNRRLYIGYIENQDETLTVYAWQHEE